MSAQDELKPLGTRLAEFHREVQALSERLRVRAVVIPFDDELSDSGPSRVSFATGSRGKGEAAIVVSAQMALHANACLADVLVALVEYTQRAKKPPPVP